MTYKPVIAPSHASWLYPRRNSDIWKEGAEGKITIFSDARLRMDCLLLNRAGSIIWELTDGNSSVAEIAQKLQATLPGTPASAATLLTDTCEFLSSLQDMWLILVTEKQPVDFLFVTSPFPSCYSPDAVKVAQYSSPPLGLCYLAAVLIAEGHSVAIEDMHIEALEPGDIVRLLEKHKPRFLGISSSTPTFPNAIRVARFARAFCPELVVAMGGIHPSAMPDEALTEGPVDLVIRGEGEATMSELAGLLSSNGFRIPRSPVPGLSLRTPDGQLLHGPDRAWTDNLDSLPFPARNLLSLQAYSQPGAMISSRGCPARCIFCSCGAFAGRTWRPRSPQSVVDEIQHLQDAYGITRVSFHDDTFNFDAQRRDICNLIVERGLTVEWDCLARVHPFDTDLAATMRDAGCCGVQFGVESGNPDVLKAIGKGITLSQAEAAVRAAAAAGIPQISCGFMLGHPADTASTMGDTIAFAERLRELGATSLTISLCTPYPGTALTDLQVHSTDWEQYVFSRVVAHPAALTATELVRAYAAALDRIHASASRRF